MRKARIANQSQRGGISYLNKMKNYSILLFSLILISCKPSLNENGSQVIKKFRKDYKCYEITIGEGERTDSRNDLFYNYLSINVVCGNFSFAEKNDSHIIELFKELAQGIYNGCNNKNEYQYIEVTYRKYTSSSKVKTFVFKVNLDRVIFYKQL